MVYFKYVCLVYRIGTLTHPGIPRQPIKYEDGRGEMSGVGIAVGGLPGALTPSLTGLYTWWDFHPYDVKYWEPNGYSPFLVAITL